MSNINVENFMMTEVEAIEKKCPYILNTGGYPIYCNPNCMSWVQARREIERENHSGAIDVIQEESRNRGYQEIKKRGPGGSQGYLYLEAQGFCLRLWKGFINE